jgi:hypothetical protein
MKQRGNGGAHSFVLLAGEYKSQDSWAFNLTSARSLMTLYNISVVFAKKKKERLNIEHFLFAPATRRCIID